MPEFRQLFPAFQHLIKEKKRIRRRWHRYRQAEDKGELNRITNKILKITRNHRNNIFDKIIEDAIKTNNSLWKKCRRLKSSKFDTRPIHGITGLMSDAEAKANAIADSLEHKFRAHETDDDYLSHYRKVWRSVFNFDHTLHQPERVKFSSSETRRPIGQMNTNKSLGPDRIPNEAIKELLCMFLKYVIEIFISAYNLQYFPKAWKQSEVVTILKPGKDLSFFRTEGLLACSAPTINRIHINRFQ